MSHTDRIVVLIDMDCFYCQVEEKLDPTLEGKPIAVVQYNAWRGGGIIAVNYPARDRGVTRHMRGDDAKKLCPEIMLPKVPNVRGKADLTKYREAGQRVAEVLQTFTPLLERASIDEAYLDITDIVKKRLLENSLPVTIDAVPNTHVVNCNITDFLHNLNMDSEFCCSNKWLAVGAMIVEEIRREVLIKTGYKCSAGIAHNKILAKLVCGLHKPNKQTILPQESVPILYKDLPIKKIKSLGGKFGNALAEELNISMMGELIKFSEKELMKKFDVKNGKWLYNIARGIDLDPVTTRLTSKSIGCCKRFPGSNCLRKHEHVEHWLNELATEISERLEKDLQENKRKAKQMVVSFAQQVKNEMERSSSRTLLLNSYKQTRIAKDSMEVIKKHSKKIDDCYNITFLGISVGNFQEIESNRSISSFFKNMNKINNSKYATDEEKNISSQNECNSLALLNDACGQDQNDSVNGDVDNGNETNCSFSRTTTGKSLQTSEMFNGFHHEENDQNLSIYSDTTEELDEDPKSLIYYEDIFPNSSTMPILQDESMKSKETTGVSRPSFFDQYFDSTTDESITSNNSSIEIGNLEKNLQKNTMHKEQIFHEIVGGEITSIDQQKIYSGENEKICSKQICPDCNKKIPVSEMAAHMDYHFALKLVRSEAHLYNPSKSQNSTNSPEPRNDKKSTKNSNCNTNRGPISKFFQPIEDSFEKTASLQDEISNHATQGIKRKTSNGNIMSSLIFDKTDEKNGEFCMDCNKIIESTDMISHNDYHLAKKIHAELNAPVKVDKHKKISSRSHKDKKSADISIYFNKK